MNYKPNFFSETLPSLVMNNPVTKTFIYDSEKKRPLPSSPYWKTADISAEQNPQIKKQKMQDLATTTVAGSITPNARESADILGLVAKGQNFEKMAPAMQMDAYSAVNALGEKFVPKAVKSKELQKMAVQQSQDWYNLVTRLLKEKLTGE